MKRTTIYLEADLEVLLKLEATRRQVSMAEVIRSTLREHLGGGHQSLPPGVGSFDSGRRDVAERSEEILRESDFGKD